MMNSTTMYNATNPYNNLPGGISPVADSSPYYNSQIGDAALQQLAKSMNYYNHTNPPLKDDSGLTFNNNNNNALPVSRKRPRESSMATTTALFYDNYNNCNNCSLISVPSGEVSGRYLGDDLSLQMMTQQQLEVDRFIALHMEKVRLEMEERRRKQSARVIETIQEAVSRKLKEKDDEIEKIGRLNWELEDRIKSVCLENQIWRDLAQTNEAAANALRLNLQQVISQADNKANKSGQDGVAEDAESFCGSSSDGCEDDGEEVDGGGRVLRWRKVGRTAEEDGRRKRMCKSCGDGESSVLLLPCRHLCVCSACGPAVETCPICSSTKNASIHVNLC